MTKKAPKETDPKLEMKIYGLNACLALFKGRPSAVIRLYLTEKRLKTLSDLVRHCVEKKLAYHVVSEEELTKVSEATHHEGVCLVIRRLKRVSLTDLSDLAATNGSWLALENIDNPHNLGAIVRTAAHFGVKGIFILGQKSSWQNGAFYRTAEGGAEALAMVEVKSLDELKAMSEKLGLTIMATTGHKGKSLYELKLPKKTIFMMGAENSGLTDKAMNMAHQLVKIPGSGVVESLNVSVATSVCLSEWFRQNQ
jgi:RNA methyltransferase, TrmH family